MPFTFSHPAAVMPLRRIRSLPTLALIVGSVTPDLPYYTPGFLYSAFRETHSLQGSIELCLPLGMILLACGLFLRRPLTALMSERARWVSLTAADRFLARRVNWLLAVPALLIGSWTHILWDALTHPGTWLVRRINILSAPVDVFGLYTGEVSHVLQYASSIFGLLVLAYWYAQVARDAPQTRVEESDRPGLRLLLLVIVVTAAIAIGSIQALHTIHPTSTFYRAAYLLITRTLAWFMLLYVAAGVLVSLTEPPQPQPEL